MKPYYQTADTTIYSGDCLKILTQLPSDSVDCIITGPPYNVGIDYGFGKKADSLKTQDYLRWLWEVWEECGRVAKEGTFLLYSYRLHAVEHTFQPPSSWRFFHLGAWYKETAQGAVWYGLKSYWEPIVMWVKGRPWKEFRSRGPVFRDVVVAKEQRHRGIHPGAFPVDLVRPLLHFACPPNGTVLDPFFGSGATLKVAQQEHKKAIGIELFEPYCAQAVKWLQEPI